MSDLNHNLGPVLFTGGNGFIAYHIIAKTFLAEPDCQIHAVGIGTTRNRHAGIQYHQFDISSANQADVIFDIARPRTIFHLASPEFSNLPPSAYYSIIVTGTRHLLAAAKRLCTVRAFVHTSSSSVIHDNVTDLVNASEDWPILRLP